MHSGGDRSTATRLAGQSEAATGAVAPEWWTRLVSSQAKSNTVFPQVTFQEMQTPGCYIPGKFSVYENHAEIFLFVTWSRCRLTLLLVRTPVIGSPSAWYILSPALTWPHLSGILCLSPSPPHAPVQLPHRL
jgi:hypothetical protein